MKNIKKKISLLLVMLLTITVFPIVDFSTYAAALTTKVSSVNLNKKTDILQVGSTDVLTATVLPKKATNKDVKWTSSNSNVVAISSADEYGKGSAKITAVSSGIAIITVTTVDGSKKSTCKVIVKPAIAVKSVKLNKTKADINVGETLDLYPKISPSNATNQAIEWTTSNSKVAEVSALGQVTAIGTGKATITATTDDGGKKATCVITVGKVKSVKLNKNKDTLTVGGGEQLYATVSPSSTTNQQVEWTSSNNDVATVSSNGYVSAEGAGKATIIATTFDGSKKATCVITVNAAVPVKSIALNKTNSTLRVGSFDYLYFKISPSNATNQEVEWTSSNPDVAIVSSWGSVTAFSQGKAIITATTKDGSKTAICNVTVKSANPKVLVKSVTLNKAKNSIGVGEKLQLSAVISPRNATNQELAWTSSNNSVATVSFSGEVTGVSVGTVTITATTDDGQKTSTCTITVKSAIPVKLITLNKTKATLKIGEGVFLYPKILPSDATNQQVEWSSSNPDVAIVSDFGQVTAYSVGTAIITAKTEDGNKIATCTVTVTPPVAVKSVTLNKTKAILNVGGYLSLYATISPSDATNQQVKWISSNEDVATVNSWYGDVTAVGAGTTTITATTEDGNKIATCTVTVNPPVAVASVGLNKTSATLDVGGTSYLNAVIYPTNATNQQVKWTSSNDAVATVTTWGAVTALGAGTATITATTVDGNKIATCIIKVATPVAVTSVALNKSSAVLTIGGGTWLYPTISPSTATNQNILWETSNPSVALVESSGYVTAVGAGTVIITATTVDGSKKATCTITVNPPVAVSSVSLNKTKAILEVGGWLNLNQTITPSDAANQEVKWTTSNSNVATVSSWGEVTAVGAGTATITVTTVDGNKTAACTVTVTAPIVVTSVALNKNSSTLTVGESSYLNAVVYPTNAANQEVKWTTSNSNVATVSSWGEVTALGVGTATITATTVDGNKTATCTITVHALVAVSSVGLNKIKSTLTIGETYWLNATISPSNAANQQILWTTSNTKVAIVNSSGCVTAVGAGTSTITATTVDGSKTATCTVTVNAPVAVSSVSLDKTSTNLTVGETDWLSVTISPSNAANQAVYWKTSNASVATVNSWGEVTAVSVGTATITVTTIDGSKKATCTVTVK